MILCNICRVRQASERNHCVIYRSKGWEKYLDVEENLEDVCPDCHKYPAHTAAHKKEFWKQQIERGYDMDKWWNSLPWQLTIGRAKPI